MVSLKILYSIAGHFQEQGTAAMSITGQQKRPPIILTDNGWSCTKSLRFLTKRAADWYKIGTGTRKFTFYGILSNADTFVFCILLLDRLHRGDVIDEQL